MRELRKFANSVIAKYPQLKEQIEDFLQLCKDEINDGSSPEIEMDLCRQSIETLRDEMQETLSYVS